MTAFCVTGTRLLTFQTQALLKYYRHRDTLKTNMVSRTV